MKLAAAILFLAIPLMAQDKKPEQLTFTEASAISAIAEKLQANQTEGQKLGQALAQIQGDIAKSHPGYHLDLATGALAKDVIPAKAEAKPEAKK